MSEYLNKIADKRNQIWHEAKGILDAAEAEGRDMSADEEARFDKASADMDVLAKRAKAIADKEAADADLSASLERGLGRKVVTPEAVKPETDMRGWLRGEVGGRSFLLPEAEARTTLNVTTAAEGKDLVATDLATQLREHLVVTSGVLQAGPTVIHTAGGNPMEFPVTTSHGAAAAVAEGITFAGTDPAFAKRAVGAWKYAQMVQVSRELLEDQVFDLTGYVARAAGRNLGLAFAPALVTGAGSSGPEGILTNATLGKTGAAAVAGVFTADDLIDLQMSVTAPYRASGSAAFIMRDATIAACRKLKDGASRYIFDPATSGAGLDRLLGQPVYPDANVAAVAATAKSVIYGDISAFLVRFAGGIRFERSDDYAFNTDLVTFRAAIRVDSVLLDQTGAVKWFAGGAAS